MTTKDRIETLKIFGGWVRTVQIDNGHRALPNSMSQYITNISGVEWVDSRMTGWGYDEDLSTEFLYDNIESLLWDMVLKIANE